jgi:hypothetical protein
MGSAAVAFLCFEDVTRGAFGLATRAETVLVTLLVGVACFLVMNCLNTDYKPRTLHFDQKTFYSLNK